MYNYETRLAITYESPLFINQSIVAQTQTNVYTPATAIALRGDKVIIKHPVLV